MYGEISEEKNINPKLGITEDSNCLLYTSDVYKRQAQGHKVSCRILPGTGNHLCRYRGYPEHPERKRPGTQDKPEVSQPAV